MIKINRASNAPLYKQVKAGLIEYIKASGTSHDQPIPSERELAEMLQLSRLTVRRSIVELAEEGVLRRIPGRGTFIVGSAVKSPVANIAFVQATNSQNEFGGVFLSRLIGGMTSACKPAALSIRTLPDLGDMRDVQGLIAMWITDSKIMNRLIDVGIPLVAYECVSCENTRAYDSIGHSNEDGAEAVISALVNLGHVDIAIAVHPSTVGRERLAGLERAMVEQGLTLAPERKFTVRATAEAGYAFAQGLLADPTHAPTAVVCSDDHIAHGVLVAAVEIGVAVPERLSLASFGDLGVFSVPAMASVHLDIYGSGRDAVRLLRERFADPNLPSRLHVLPTEFIRRASCAQRRR